MDDMIISPLAVALCRPSGDAGLGRDLTALHSTRNARPM
jgi:hypothetical protein